MWRLCKTQSPAFSMVSFDHICQIKSRIMSRCTVFILLLVVVTSVHCEESCPGRDKSPGKQCEDKGHNGLCKTADPATRCSVLECTYTGRGDIPEYATYRVGPALQGTWCGTNKICIEGKCREDPSPPKTPSATITDKEYDCLSYED